MDKVKVDIKEKGLSAAKVYDRATLMRMSSYIDSSRSGNKMKEKKGRCDTHENCHYGSILWPLHDRGFNDVCVTWNKGVRRMLNVSNMTHTALLGEIINTCRISIQLVKRFCKFVDLMLTSCNAIVRHFVRGAINSAQSLIGRNIAVIRHRYAICVGDINVKHVHRQYPSSQPELSGTARCILELLCVSNNETYLPGFTKSEVDTMINALCTC